MKRDFKTENKKCSSSSEDEFENEMNFELETAMANQGEHIVFTTTIYLIAEHI